MSRATRRRLQKAADLPPEALAFFMKHPVEFAEFMIYQLTPEQITEDKIDKRLEWQSKRILHAVANHDYVTIPAGRGCCKTMSLALLVLWFTFTRNDARIMCTGPKFDQLKATLWVEVNKWLQRSLLTDKLSWSSEHLNYIDADVISFAQVMTSKDKENISGIHARSVLWIIDEASNVEEDIIDAIMGGMNDPESKIVMAGNPTKASGAFFNSFTRDKGMWHVIHLSSEDSARANPVWFKKMERYPRNSDVFRVNVLGLPPLGNPLAVIPLSDCEAARDRTVAAGDFLEMGVDPASEGDDLCAIGIRQGMKVLEIRTYAKTKAHEVVGFTLEMLREYRRKTGVKTKVRIKVDDTGYGQAVRHYLALNETDNIEVIPCLFGGKGNAEYADGATVMMSEMRDAIDECELPNDDDLIEELSTREWKIVGKKIESKKEYKKRLKRSPDKGDCCLLLFSKGQKKVFGDNVSSENAISDFEVDWMRQHITDTTFKGVLTFEILHFAALVLGEDLSVSGIAAVYQQYVDKLWIYQVFHQDSPIPDRLAQRVRFFTRKGIFDDERDCKILGNERMFRSEGDRRPLSDILVREGLFVSKSPRFDEYGAIAQGTKMFRESKVNIHKNASPARSAISLWTIEKDKFKIGQNGYGMALLMILSEVRFQKKEVPSVRQPRDYSPLPEEPDPHIDREKYTAWMYRR